MRRRKKLTARENILKIKDVCLKFVNSFNTTYNNLIFYGPTGVGKSFMTHCIAKSLLDTSHTVVYLTSLQLFDILEKNKFNKYDISTSNEQISYILNCDLLIIDDLGTELVNSFTSSQLYYFIEERHLNQKPSTPPAITPDRRRQRHGQRIGATTHGTPRQPDAEPHDIGTGHDATARPLPAQRKRCRPTPYADEQDMVRRRDGQCQR